MDSIQIHEKNKNNVLMIVKLNVKKKDNKSSPRRSGKIEAKSNQETASLKENIYFLTLHLYSCIVV